MDLGLERFRGRDPGGTKRVLRVLGRYPPQDELVNWTLSQTTTGPAARLVLAQMALQCDIPSLQVVFNNRAAAKTLNLTVKTVRQAIAELEACGLISSRGTKPLDGHRYLKVWKLEYD